MSDKKKVRKPRRHPTEKQIAFAYEYVDNGGDATKAYKVAYDTTTDNKHVPRRNASKLLNNDHVATMIKDIRMERYSGKVITIKERKEILSQLSLEGDTKALDLLNKMEAVYDDKADVNVNVFERPVIKKLTKDDIKILREDLKEK